ncbi:MAG: single-stranded DNA-binding protein [Sphingobacterium sp.]|uniref:single-stranded DNA-binding protein n=1 Tax=Sphingobacterium sp. JB170 TaxID=1434842 RepID=UPI00097EF198|nr:single-stranded DNA-binding protein [Sphingobacterium sp. JB170]SJN17488.1 Single-stranded DNA-binding protein [Sphingobacterium sp. JB170]
MNMLVNAVQLIGRLGADVEINSTSQGIKVANVRLATNEYSKNGKGEWNEITYWHSLVFWGKQAEKLLKTCKKGTKIILQGSLVYHEYKDIQEINRHVAEIRVASFMILENPIVLERGIITFNPNHEHEEEEAPF